MYRVLSKYNLITVLPFEDTFFHATQLQKKVKLSKDLLKINYLKYSPFTNPNIITITHEQQLMLWFYTKEVNTPIIIAESYLLFKALKEEQEDTIYVIHDTIVKILILKASCLVGAFTLSSLDESSIVLSMDEFHISKRVDITLQEYKTLKFSTLKNLSFEDIYKANQLHLDRETILPKFIEYASYPIAALVIFAMLVSYGQEKMLHAQIDSLKTTYLQNKTKNKKIKNFIKIHNKKVKKWQDFADKELAYISPTLLLAKIYEIFKDKEKAHFIDVSINAHKMLVKLATNENPVVFLNRLNAIDSIANVIIQNTYKPRDAMKIISYEIEIKKHKDV